MTSEYKTRVPPFHAGHRFTDGDGGLTQAGADALNILRRRTGGSDDFISEEQVISIAQNQIQAFASEDGIIGAFFFVLTERVDTLETRLNVATGEESLENGAGELTSHQVNQIKNIDSAHNISVNNWGVVDNLITQTVWTPSTGTSVRGGMNADSNNPPSATYQQIEVSAINTDVREVRRILKAMQLDLTDITILGA